jgi:hypothetical protein
MAGDGENRDAGDALLREVVALRQRVAELQRAAARHEETEGISLAEREELLREAERVAQLSWSLASARRAGPHACCSSRATATRRSTPSWPIRCLASP